MTTSTRRSPSLLRRAAVLAAACVVIGPVLAQGVDKHVPTRQRAPSKPTTAISVLPPPVHATPLSPSKSDTRGIIFVGGKSALNPQPIPPGRPVVDPQK